MKPAYAFLLTLLIKIVQPTCVLESDFGFKINCAFKKSGLFRVRNLGGIKAHASLGLSLGDELGFEQSLTNLDQSRRRSVNVKNGAPLNYVTDTSVTPAFEQEKRGKQNRIMMRPIVPVTRPNPAAMDKLSTLHRHASSTMKPIIVVPGPTFEAPSSNRGSPSITMAKPMPMGVPPFKPLPPKPESLKVLPLQVMSPKGPGLAYQNSVPHQVHDLADMYPVYNTRKVDNYNTISGYGDDTTLKFNKDDINVKIAEIAKAGNISMEAVEAAIALRQQQLLNKYANLPVPTSTTSTTTTTTTAHEPLIFQPEPETEIITPTQKPKLKPTTGKVMNAPREYYPVGYEKNFDDLFQSKVDLPETNFNCGDQKYFPGLYGDESLGCMVFHVCALTDDGLVMKSFLCPESTLFDQTILKCNWWFYVDCKNTKRLYDANIPVSKSYQLMKALTFFSSYKKEMLEGGHIGNPEDTEGIKKGISILENQDTKPAAIIDERKSSYSHHKISEQQERSETKPENPDHRLVAVNANMSFDKSGNTGEKNTKEERTSAENIVNRRNRRKMTLQNSVSPNQNNSSTTTPVSLITEDSRGQDSVYLSVTDTTKKEK